MGRRTSLYLNGLLAGYAFSILINLLFSAFLVRDEAPLQMWLIGLLLVGFGIFVFLRLWKHHREDLQVAGRFDRYAARTGRVREWDAPRSRVRDNRSAEEKAEDV